TVLIKNSSRGTMTDDKGNFSIEAGGADTLIFSLVGYQTLELPLEDYEPGMIRLSEKYTMLQAVTIDEFKRQDFYEGMFEDQNARLKKSIPFYFSKAKKEKIKVQGLRDENLRVQTYVDVVVNSPDLKADLMKKHSLSEPEYYNILTAFNEQHYRVMYYLTRAELVSLLNTFFEGHAR
ncbi:MAG TPA: carboxypeptidase-like regulatory domain-containing protein, partial [Chryseosolibacter sp.]